MDNKEKVIGELIELSSQKLYSLREILEVTENQRSCIAEDRIEELNELFEKKQSYIDDINKLDEDFNKAFDDLKKTLNLNTIAELQAVRLPNIKELQDTIADIIEIMGEIQKLEFENEERLNAQMKEVKEQLKRINHGNQAIKGYTAQTKPDAFFIDRKK